MAPKDSPATAPRRSDPSNDPVGLLRERLLDREAQLRVAQEMAEFGIWEWDIASDRVLWSKEPYRIYGLHPDSFTASYSGFLAQVHPDDRGRVDAIVQDAFMNALDFQFEHRIVRPDGTIRVLEARGRTIVDENGKVFRMVGTGRDISDQRQAETQAARADVAIEIAHRLADPQRITDAALTHLGLDELLPELL